MTDREALALIVGVPGISYGLRHLLMMETEDMNEVLEEPERFAAVLGEANVEAVCAKRQDAQRELDAMREAGVELLTIGDAIYPPLLKRITRPPHVLFVRGSTNLNAELAIAMVGTRRASEYGMAHARRISAELVRGGACVVSGLALGIDTAAHEGTLDAGGRTIAVLGGAHDQLYPRGNRGLVERIVETGGSVITEYPMGRHPDKYSFLERNRIVVGLCHGVAVIEGPARSGALNTAHIALDEGRELFALPGDVGEVNSVLPNTLIAEGAKLITGGADILNIIDRYVLPVGRKELREAQKAGRDMMPPSRRILTAKIEPKDEPPAGEKPAARKPAERKPTARRKPAEDAPRRADPQRYAGLGEKEMRIVAALEGGMLDFDTLAEVTGLNAGELGTQLTMLELDGLIRVLPGRQYALA